MKRGCLLITLTLASTATAADPGRLVERPIEVSRRGDPILRDDFQNCQPGGSVLIDERPPGHWVLRIKDWGGGPRKMLNPIGLAPEITYDPKLRGVFDIVLGIRSVDAVMSFGIRLSSETEFTTVTAPMATPDLHEDLEFCWKRAAALEGEQMVLKPLGKAFYLSYIKFIPILRLKQVRRAATDHVVICKEAEAHFAFPGAVRLSSGEILAVFREGKAHVDPSGRIALCRSADGGRTWSPRSVVYDDPDVDERDPGIMQHANGTVVVSFASRGSQLRRSTDGGRTWDKPSEAPVFSPHGPRQAPDGQLYYCGIRTEKGINHVDIVRSKDLGVTWEPWTCVAQSLPWHQPMVKEFWDEPFAAPVSPSRWLCIHRVDLNGYLYQNFSDDGGAIWPEEPKKTGMWGCPGHLLRLADGRIVCTYGYRRAPFGIRACLSRDQGRTWDVDREIVLRDDAGHGDLGYPVSIELDGGLVLAVYYFNDKSRPADCHIAGTFFRP